MTVKTTESSLEKHTVIEGGNVVTTVHETERVDGEVTKDDIVQVKSAAAAEAGDKASAVSGKSTSLSFIPYRSIFIRLTGSASLA